MTIWKHWSFHAIGPRLEPSLHSAPILGGISSWSDCMWRVRQIAVFLLMVIVGAPAGLAQNALPSGSVGIATYATISQFKDLHVQAGGQDIFHNTLSEGL